MDVLVIERDELVGDMLAETLDVEGISTQVTSDDEAFRLPVENAPQLVITGINRGHDEDLRGLKLMSAMRRKWPQICVIYLSALWPVCLRHEMLGARGRFLTKPVRLPQLVRTVRELLQSSMCHAPANAQNLR
jgi:DNA-binding response OmpR family regulator